MSDKSGKTGSIGARWVSESGLNVWPSSVASDFTTGGFQPGNLRKSASYVVNGRGFRETIAAGPLYTEREICSDKFSALNGLSASYGNDADGSKVNAKGGSPGLTSVGGSIKSNLSY